MWHGKKIKIKIKAKINFVEQVFKYTKLKVHDYNNNFNVV